MSRTAAEGFALLDAAGVPCEISSADFAVKMWHDPQAQREQWIAKYPHRMLGEVGQVGLAVTLSDTPTRIQGAPVIVGEQTRAILADLGYTSEEIEALFESGAVGDETVYPSLAKNPEDVPASPWDHRS